MSFREYQHIEKFGNEEVEGIELGKVYVFPKLDGTNSSLWKATKADGPRPLSAGSRTRPLSLENDNAGFYAAHWQDEKLLDFFDRAPNLRLYGEWLVPHSFKGYRPEAWRKFYVFDVYNDDTNEYLSYEQYQPILEQWGIEYIPPLATIKNASYENFLRLLNENRYLCPDGGDPGEGIVIKNYNYYNKFGRQIWAKIVRQEFKELHAKTMGSPDINGGLMNEERIINRVLTTALIDKTFNKILNDIWNKAGNPILGPIWTSKYIPRLLETVFYDLVKEELWDALKEIGFGTVNFKTLKALTIRRIKELKPEIFT